MILNWEKEKNLISRKCKDLQSLIFAVKIHKKCFYFEKNSVFIIYGTFSSNSFFSQFCLVAYDMVSKIASQIRIWTFCETQFYLSVTAGRMKNIQIWITTTNKYWKTNLPTIYRLRYNQRSTTINANWIITMAKKANGILLSSMYWVTPPSPLAACKN